MTKTSQSQNKQCRSVNRARDEEATEALEAWGRSGELPPQLPRVTKNVYRPNLGWAQMTRILPATISQRKPQHAFGCVEVHIVDDAKDISLELY